MWVVGTDVDQAGVDDAGADGRRSQTGKRQGGYRSFHRVPQNQARRPATSRDSLGDSLPLRISLALSP